MHTRLKQLRLGFGIDQAAMARLMGVAPVEWGGWEAGEALPSSDATAAIASRLGLSTDWLRGAAVPMWGNGCWRCGDRWTSSSASWPVLR